MTKKELIDFAKHYDQIRHITQIEFEEESTNYEFRTQLSEAIKNDFSICNDQLIIDLFVAWSLQAKANFAVYRNYHLLANELLERGGAKYLNTYADGAAQCMDTAMASGRLNLSKGRITEILKHIEEVLTSNQNEDKLKQYRFLHKRFQWLSSQ